MLFIGRSRKNKKDAIKYPHFFQIDQHRDFYLNEWLLLHQIFQHLLLQFSYHLPNFHSYVVLFYYSYNNLYHFFIHF